MPSSRGETDVSRKTPSSTTICWRRVTPVRPRVRCGNAIRTAISLQLGIWSRRHRWIGATGNHAWGSWPRVPRFGAVALPTRSPDFSNGRYFDTCGVVWSHCAAWIDDRQLAVSSRNLAACSVAGAGHKNYLGCGPPSCELVLRPSNYHGYSLTREPLRACGPAAGRLA